MADSSREANAEEATQPEQAGAGEDPQLFQASEAARQRDAAQQRELHRRAVRGGCWVVMPGIVAAVGHLLFVCALLGKWEKLEDASDGPLNFTAAIMDMSALPDAGSSWYLVFWPLWTAQVIVCVLSSLSIARGMMMPNGAPYNAVLSHVNTICQLLSCSIFQLLLAHRLESASGAWMLVFSPMYFALVVQASLHYRKEPDQRGRRPGFPIGLLHLLALVVSFKLDGAFNYENSTWGNVLWPLWGVGGFFLLSFSMAVCCGLPCLLRRDHQVRCHLICMFSALLLLLGSVILPALIAAVRMSLWLDGDTSVSARAILAPYLVAISVVVLLLCVSLAILSFSSAVRARALHGPDGAARDADDGDPMTELVSMLPTPTALVRESSTLFRRASSATMDKFEKRHQVDALAAANEPKRSLLAHDQSRSRSGVDSSGSSENGAIELTDITPRAAELAEICIDQPTPPPDAHATGAETAGVDGSARREPEGSATSAADAADDSSSRVRAGGKLVDDEDEDGLGGEFCWICCSGPRDAVLLECGHGGICFSCAERCARKRPPLCPMCRQRIVSIVRVTGTPEMVDGEVVVPASCACGRSIASSASSEAAATASELPTPAIDASASAESATRPLMQ